MQPYLIEKVLSDIRYVALFISNNIIVFHWLKTLFYDWHFSKIRVLLQESGKYNLSTYLRVNLDH